MLMIRRHRLYSPATSARTTLRHARFSKTAGTESVRWLREPPTEELNSSQITGAERKNRQFCWSVASPSSKLLGHIATTLVFPLLVVSNVASCLWERSRLHKDMFEDH